MFTEFILNSFFDWLSLLLSPINIDIPVGTVDAFMSYLDVAAYFVPIGTLYVLFSFIIAKEGIKISIAFIKFVLKFMPFMG